MLEKFTSNILFYYDNSIEQAIICFMELVQLLERKVSYMYYLKNSKK